MVIGSNIIFIRRLTSSNTYASQLLKRKHPPEGTVISAGYQSGGRGQTGNTWESQEGRNLLISIIMYPAIVNPSDQFLISMMISLGITDLLMKYIESVKIKWPNDIYVNDDKIAGILLENSIIGNEIEHTIAGIGLNINQREFPDDVPNPVSLGILTGKDYDLDKCLGKLLAAIDSRYDQLLSGSWEKIRNDYISMLYRHREWHYFKSDGGIFKGRILSVNSFGQLLVENENGKIKSFSLKEVEFLRYQDSEERV